MDAHRSNLLDLAGAGHDLAGQLQGTHTCSPAFKYIVAGPAAAASWVLELPASDLSNKLASLIFVPTNLCRIRIIPLVPTAAWDRSSHAQLQGIIVGDRQRGENYRSPYFSLPRQVVGTSGATTNIKVKLELSGLAMEPANWRLSCHKNPRAPLAPIQTAPPIIYSALVGIKHMREEQSRPGMSTAKSRDCESILMSDFLGLLIVVELHNVPGAEAPKGGLDSWRHFVRLLTVDVYKAMRDFVARGGLDGRFARDAATWFVEHASEADEGEFDVFLAAAQRAIDWVKMLFTYDHTGRPIQPAFEFRSLKKAAHSAFVPQARRVL
ncbi:uncharacterized protein RHOBADRAFT_45215 [Rhodotorula graminis WP1]|uniref:Uncharacterized protein n=1 Tax=Rhodotorula graminis (strain WP1) TaxID=578459 RepID=A0A0P9IVZ3_RHOGW|nr:uncharacterized protein RHOBADRAFT_45215 [Rhodotorula graminis WP1]KPV73923.1 hypothetical protein RHOBADRAFT_45215 [Rhodotorula graminis WP1]